MFSRLLLFFLLLLSIQSFGKSPGYLRPVEYETAINDSFPENTKILVLEKDGLRGLKDAEGNVLIPAIYEEVGWSSGKMELVQGTIGFRKGKLWGLIDAKGNVVSSAKYLSLEPLDGFIKASVRGKVTGNEFYGIISNRNKVLLPFRYAELNLWEDRVIAITRRGNDFNYGVTNLTGETLIPFKYFHIFQIGSDKLAVEDYSGKIALFDKLGNPLTPFEFDSISTFNDHYAVIYKEAKQGLLHDQQGIVLKADHKNIEIAEGVRYLDFPDWHVYRKGAKTGEIISADSIIPFDKDKLILRVNQHEVVRSGNKNSVIFDEIHPHTENAWRVSRNGKFGLTDSAGQIIIPIVFDSVFLDDEFAYCWNEGSSQQGWKIIDFYGTERTRHLYQEVRPYENGLFPVKRKNKWGFLDRQGNEVIFCVYESIEFYARDLIRVRFHGEEGIIDNQGDWVVYPVNGNIEIVDREHYLVRTRRQSRFYSMQGDLIYFTNNSIRNVDGYLLEKVDSVRHWQIDFKGVRVQESSIENIYPIYKDSIYVINDRGRVGLRVRGNGDVLFSENYTKLYPPSEGFMKVEVGDRFGFVNYDGVLRIAHRYEDAHDFHNGLAAIKILGRWGFIDKTEHIVIQPYYDWVGDFEDGLAMVRKNDKYGLINAMGELIEDIRFDQIEKLSTRRYLVTEEGKLGLLDQRGEILVFTKYEEIIDPGNGNLIICRNGKYGISSLSGVAIVPTRYDSIIHDPYLDQYYLGKFPSWKTLN